MISEATYEHQEKGATGYRFDHMPRWIEHSGLPKKLGGSSWQLFKKLMEVSSRYGLDKMGSRFHISHQELGRLLGRKRKFIRQHSERLKRLKYIHYKAGTYKGKEAQYQIIYPVQTPAKITEIDWKDGGLKDLPSGELLNDSVRRYLREFVGLRAGELKIIGEGYSESVSNGNPLKDNNKGKKTQSVSNGNALENDRGDQQLQRVSSGTQRVSFSPQRVSFSPQRVSNGHNSETLETLETEEKEDPAALNKVVKEEALEQKKKKWLEKTKDWKD